ESSSGRMAVSKTVHGGSNPSSPALIKKSYNLTVVRLFYYTSAEEKPTRGRWLLGEIHEKIYVNFSCKRFAV
ncbi:MAG: hypothetical protein WBI07_05630, partial [Mobilitalea sp.]